MSQKSIHQLVHTLSYGDAISGEVLAMQRALTQAGCDSKIYAINEHPKLKGLTIPYQQLSSDYDGQIILHYSLGSPLNDLYRSLTKATRVLIYHNLTPAKYYAGINPRVASDIEQGAKELPELLGLSNKIIADSKFNAGELAELGFKAEVLDLPIDPVRWEMETNPGIASLLKNDPVLHLVHVGRFAPNKCIEDIIKVAYLLKEKLKIPLKLWLPGIDIDTEIYSFSLKRLVYFLGLEKEVNFVGCFADSELKALYENSSVYLCMSEHEGFCLPVVEAMHFGLPVIAFASSALPDTIGAGGLLVNEKDHLKIAALVEEVHNNQELRQKLIIAGKERVQSLSFEKFQNNLSKLLLS